MALMYVIGPSYCDSTLVELLINAGAHLEVTDSHGRTAVMHATLHRRKGVILTLVSAGANLHAMDVGVNTPLTLPHVCLCFICPPTTTIQFQHRAFSNGGCDEYMEF